MWTDEVPFRQLVKSSTSQSDALRRVGLRPASNAVTFRKYAALYNVDLSHFIRAGRSTRNHHTRTPLQDILVEHSTYSSRHRLKLRLVEEGVLKYECAHCPNTGTWQSKPLTLQLEHKNGVSTDNRLDNLELLCPNCHSQTGTFAGRNK